MQYMILIYGEESPNEPPLSAEMMQPWVDYDAALTAAGVNVAGEALHDSGSATTVRVRDGETVVTDGPFAETKEVLGGYYIVDCDDLDAAIEWGSKCPAAQYGSIEVRPVMDLSAFS